MSRARKIIHSGEEWWFDVKSNNLPASVDHLDLLASVENKDTDDLLEEGLNQGEVIKRLREALGQGAVPAHVLENQRKRREQQNEAVLCAFCSVDGRECEGYITRHHFIPKWLMKELDNYEAYARRDKCTMPACMGRHRDLHMRITGAKDKSVAKYMTNEQKEWAQKMLSELEEQHPGTIELIRGGWPEVSYEAQLIRDYDLGKFRGSGLTSSQEQVYFVAQVSVAVSNTT